MTEEEVSIKITASIDELKQKLDEASGRFDQFSAKAKQTALTIGGGMAIVKLIHDSQQAYTTQLTAEMKLGTILKNNLGYSEQQLQATKNIAAEQQKIGIVGDEVQMAGQAQIGMFAKLQGTVEALTPAMNDLIAKQDGFNASASTASSVGRAIGMALNGQTSMLKRNNIALTEAQENMILYGSESDKVKTIIEAIEGSVGGMNEKLRNTSAGQIAALMNDLGDLKEDLGAAFQPLIVSTIPILSQSLKDLHPLISGIGVIAATVGGVISSMNPELRQTIVYVTLGGVALKALTASLGGAAAGLIVGGAIITALIGKFKEAQDAAAEVDTSAADAANEAAGAQDEWNKKIGDTQKAINRLAGFDEITKLSGGSGSGLMSGLVGDIETAQKAIEGLEIPDLGIPLTVDYDLNDILSTASKIGGNIWDLLFGDDDKKYAALKDLNKYIEDVFGPEFTGYWQDFGSKAYDLVDAYLNGDEQSVWFAARALNDKLKDIPYWEETISPLFQKLGGAIQSTGAAIGKMLEGDTEGATVALAKGFAQIGLFDSQKAAELENAYLSSKYGDPAHAHIENDKILSQQQNWLEWAWENSWANNLNKALHNGEGMGSPYDDPSFELGKKIYKAQQLRPVSAPDSTTHLSEYGVGQGGGGRQRNSGEDRSVHTSSTNSIFGGGGRVNVETVPMLTEEGVYDAVSASAGKGGMPSEIRIYLDGREMNDSQGKYSDENTIIGNGR